ncbi:MAG: phospholipid carrier-dependent glycosyltransferase [Verrucomicrobiae bacterium]|nr:phospholipid carrier-dependent glycosyltransferase [Verrucomicrobiae bacterium]
MAALCACFAFFVIIQARTTSPTYDETGHLASGYMTWLWDDYRMSPDHPPLVRKLAAFPLRFMNVWPSREEWNATDGPIALQRMRTAWALAFAKPDAWKGFDHLMFYGVRDETLRRFGVNHPFLVPTTAKLDRKEFFNDTDGLVFAARMMISLLGLLLALLVYAWARELFGTAGGLLALALACFDPNFIAHSAVVTTDIGVTAFMFGAVYFFWRTCRRLNVVNVGLAGLFCGLALASKSSAVFLVLFLVPLGLIRVFNRNEWPSRFPIKLQVVLNRFAAVVAVGLATALIAYTVLWATYGFRYSAAQNPEQTAQGEAIVLGEQSKRDVANPRRQPGRFPIEDNVRRAAAVKQLLAQLPKDAAKVEIQEADVQLLMETVTPGPSGRTILFFERHRLFPEAFLYGMSGYGIPYQRVSFLRGEFSQDGFHSYLLWSSLLKTPLVTLIAMGAALVFVLRKRETWWNAAFLLIPAAIYFFIAVESRVSVGHRHILPAFPFLLVLCGVVAVQGANWKQQVPLRSIAALVLIASSAIFISPHFLAYFNPLAGGPRNGHKSLVDSNCDWGQDLKGLKRWLDTRGITEPINLCYFGTADPRYYQIPCVNVAGTYEYAPQVDFKDARLPGYIAISATNLEGMYFTPEGRALWRKFLANATLVDTVGHSIFIYRKEAP